MKDEKEYEEILKEARKPHKEQMPLRVTFQDEIKTYFVYMKAIKKLYLPKNNSQRSTHESKS